MFRFSTGSNIPTILAKEAYSLQKGTVSSIFYIFLLHLSEKYDVFQCCILHAKYACSFSYITKTTRTQVFTSTLSYFINILSLYVNVCVSSPWMIGLMCVYVLLKTKICILPFAVSRTLSEAKWYRWNLNINKYFIRYLRSFMQALKQKMHRQNRN